MICGPVVILGGGPSLRGFDVERLRGLFVIAVNESYALCPWADVLFFNDNQWFDDHRLLIDGWHGTVASTSRHAHQTTPERVTLIDLPEQPMGRGRSSGHTAVSVAALLGASTILLLGYDMRHVYGRSHWHRLYSHPFGSTIYSEDFLPAWEGWRHAAEARGVDVINCTPDSALTEFRCADIGDFLACGK